MKRQILMGLALAASLTLAPAQAHDTGKPHGDAPKAQRVTVTITSSGYSPSTVSVKAGRPVQMTFVSKEASCGNAVVIPALKQSFTLQPGGRKTVTFTPKRGQSLGFACSMEMFRGRVAAK